MMRTANPTLSENNFRNITHNSKNNEVMTIDGTVSKITLLLLITIASAAYFWFNIETFSSLLPIIMIGSIIIALIIAIITVFKKEWSPVTAPLYVIFEGIFLGIISYFFESIYPGIVIQAVSLTFGTLLCLLLIYKSGLIKVTENFKLGIVAATGAIFMIYMATFILGIFGINIPYIHGNGTIGIIFSLVVVVIAALNLVLDFDFIENAAKQKLPKYMEWYAAFGLMVTLIWLYIEILRLLSKIRSRD